MTVGIDIIEIDRIKRAAERAAFWDRILTENEKECCRLKGNKIAFLAGRFAAKEAVMKSLGVGLSELSFKDIEILNDQSGKPGLTINQALFEKMQLIGLEEIALSISHSRDYAIAIAVGEGKKSA